MAHARAPSHGRHRSTSSLSSSSGAQGEFHPAPDTSADLYDLCNAFWSPDPRAAGRRDAQALGREDDWGKEGFDRVLQRVKTGGRGVEDLRALLKERASAAEDYAKRLLKLSKHSFGTGETGHMERAQLQLKSELESSARSQTDLAQLLRQQEATTAEFAQKRDAVRKTPQQNIEKLWKNLLNQRAHVLKAKEKYEADAIQINALHAQASLLQGKELDKVSIKLDKVQQSVEVNERDYRNYTTVLKQTTVEWNMAWKAFCDLVQDQEEERLEFVKSRMWDYANGLSAVAMQEDESAERTRTALEQCDPKVDVRIFVSQFGTGSLIPDPIPFVDVKAKEPPPKQGYKTARFIRSSTRIPGVKHSPSAVGDITRAMGQQPQPQRQASLPPQQQQQMSRPSSQPEAVGAARPHSRAANRASNPNLAAETATATPPPQPQSQPQNPQVQAPATPSSAPALAPAVPVVDASLSPSRFAVSPGANLRARPSSEHIPAASPTTSRPGHISAGAFQNRLSLVSPSLGSGGSAVGEPSEPAVTAKPARYEPPPPAREPAATAPAPAAPDDDEDDPLVVALRALQAKPPPSPSARASRSSVDLRGAAASPTSQQARPPSRGGHYAQQPSFGSAAAAARSRPTSPAPTAAAYMQAPPPAQQQRARSPSIPYSRPQSRAGSAVSAAAQHLASPPPAGQFAPRPTSPARGTAGRSPSPQPFIPESLRPGSPNPAAMAQQQGRPQSAYGAPPPQAQAQQPPIGYGAPPPQQQYGAPHGYPAAAAPPQQQQPAPYAPPTSASPYGRAPSPAQPQRPPSIVGGYGAPPQAHQQQHLQQQHQQQSYLAQAPSQPQLYQSPPPAAASPYQHPPPPQQHAAPPNGYGYAQPQQQQAYARSPSVVGGYAPPPSLGTAPLARTASTHSGVSGVSVQQTPLQAYGMQPQTQQRPSSVAGVRAGAAQPPPTGQHTESGQPILFYVNALYDYAASSAEEFSFSTGDVISVTGTDPDGWWYGQRVGDPGPSKLFPSNFTELLP
ncbi:formin-binding protein [Rhodotorula kratochvilovae]